MASGSDQGSSAFSFFCDGAIGFQDSATPIMEGIVDLHNYIFFYLVLVSVFVFWVFTKVFVEFVLDVGEGSYIAKLRLRRDHFAFSQVTHLPILEIIWTIIPSFILMLIAVPSFTLLYAMDEVIDPALTFKAIGHQWYWSYEYTDDLSYPGIFDSYMVSEAELKLGQPRLLTVDNSVVLPINTHVRVIITADDVLHSWAVPALGLKVDAVPGRLSQLSLFVRREGVYYGQCSELCGVNHGFMPISIRAVEPETYLSWYHDSFRPKFIAKAVTESIPEPTVPGFRFRGLVLAPRPTISVISLEEQNSLLAAAIKRRFSFPTQGESK